MEKEVYYCGELFAPEGLEPIGHLLLNCSWAIGLIRSGFDGTLYLQASHDEISLEMDSGQHRCFLFSGIISGSDEMARQLLGEFSRLLSDGKIAHRIEWYESSPHGKFIENIHYNWSFS